MTEYRDSPFFSLTGERWMQRCRHEGQFHPTALFARFISLIEEAHFNLTEGQPALARRIHGMRPFSERRDDRLEEYALSSFAATQQPELHMDRSCLSAPPSMADRCLHALTQSCRLVNVFAKDSGPLGSDVQLFLRNHTIGGAKLAVDVARGELPEVFAFKLSCTDECDWLRIANRLEELAEYSENIAMLMPW